MGMMTKRILIPAMLIAILSAIAVAQTPEQFVIDPAQTTVTLHVGKSGIFSVAGHEHEVIAPGTKGQITLGRPDVGRSSVSMTFDAAALKVTGKDEPAGDVPEVQRVMLSDRVLDVQKYPTITFQSREVSATKPSADQMTLRISGDLTLHGVTQRVDVPVTVQLAGDGLHASGKATVKQTQFGIKPVTAGGGAVKVKDEVEVVFSVAAKRQ
jgi:polyisoprenoid-binding protein YceI